MMSSSSSLKICFNSSCKDVLERARKGWRRRTGEFADLCDRCASAYEEGKFCETFHTNASGWRCCESCGKQIHCGCIVSFHMFVLLDPGGIECITCARKSFILTPNPAWPPPSLFVPPLPDRMKDLSAQNWGLVAGSGPVPWRQAPSLFSSSSAQSGCQPRMPSEVDIPNSMDRLTSSERLSASYLEKKNIEDSSGRSMNGSLKLGASELLENGNEGNGGVEANPFVNVPQKATFSKNDTSMAHFGIAVSSALPNEANDQTKAFGSPVPQPTSPPLIGKRFCGHNGADPSVESQIRNGRPRGDARLRNQLLPRYWPKITDQELQRISGNSNSVTALFEKMLSASDAGRIGRLVLPKKCAEAYFPSISQPEGLPLKVQDSKGKEWIFQFRFWPNNNSRMYVLEGVTPCIQSMQLQAGDVVTFSRIEPEGKLVMGFRKASTAPPSDKGSESVNVSNGVSTKGVNAKKNKPGDVLSTLHQLKGNSVSPCYSPIDQANSADVAPPQSKDDNSRCAITEVVRTKPSFRSKRKNNILGSRVKQLKIEDKHVIELELPWEQAQGLLRPPPNCVPSVAVIEGVEFEEYEDAPIIGRPTIFATNCGGEKIQWAQCEDCFQWRKIPSDALLPSRWTCSENSWDPERSVCSMAQELTAEQLEDLLPGTKPAASKKMKVAKWDPDSVGAREGLDALANLAIQEEGGSLQESSQTTTTKHPRHRPGCSCVVCIQPPSGKGPKHNQTCTCTICLMVKRRFQTLMSRREKKQSEKESETLSSHKFQRHHPFFSENFPDEIVRLCSNAGDRSPDRKMTNCEDFANNDVSRITSSVSPFKGQIDLNIQPERDDELSPRSDSDVVKRLMENAIERDIRPRLLSSINTNNSDGDGLQFGGIELEEKLRNGIALGSSIHLDSEAECYRQQIQISTNNGTNSDGDQMQFGATGIEVNCRSGIALGSSSSSSIHRDSEAEHHIPASTPATDG